MKRKTIKIRIRNHSGVCVLYVLSIQNRLLYKRIKCVIRTDLGSSVHIHRNYAPMVMMNYPFVQVLLTFFLPYFKHIRDTIHIKLNRRRCWGMQNALLHTHSNHTYSYQLYAICVRCSRVPRTKYTHKIHININKMPFQCRKYNFLSLAATTCTH